MSESSAAFRQMRHDINQVMFALVDIARELNELHRNHRRDQEPPRRPWAVHLDTSMVRDAGGFRVPHMASPDCGCFISKAERDEWYAAGQRESAGLGGLRPADPRP